MPKSKLFITLIAAFLVINCSLVSVAGPGNVVTYEKPFSEFDKVEISHAFSVEIAQGENFEVLVNVDENLVDDLQVTQVGSTLKIGLQPTRAYNTTNATLEAEITVPELIGLELTGASEATVSGFNSTEPFYVGLSGNSTLRGDLEAGDTRFEASGESSVRLSGSAGYVTAVASGSSEVDLTKFPVINATANASGASTVTVNVIGGLDATASGGSRIYYLGDPNLGVASESGGAEIRPR